ncbi:MAG: DUF2071 domain-containing protein [Acidimicrobiia bacterium]|nr:DUF2071 domain-containing protein [Acidimicrobiia bacterium]
MSSTIERTGLFPSECPYVAGRPAVSVGWSSVGFVHWGYEPDRVARLLPDNLQVDVYGGQAWVGYQFLTVTPGAGTRLGRLAGWATRRAAFHEMRLTVCVVDRDGRPGVHYLSIDIDRSAIVRWQRRVLNLPAFHSGITASATVPGVAEYRSRRSDDTTARLRMQVGSSVADTDIDHFLTARWRILLPQRFWVGGTEHRWVVTAHDPWLLHRASVVTVDEDALLAGGLPVPGGPAHGLWSPGVDVRISRPQTATDGSEAA